MWSKVLQDWIALESKAGVATPIVQSAPNWLPTEMMQDAWFLIECKYVSTSGIYLLLETAPCCEDGMFLAMNAATAIDLSTFFGSSLVYSALAHTTAGPPLASYLRWKIQSSATTWVASFRITMCAI